ncbi:unnamed protein product, partial [Iphiclides podalirius]
MVVIETVGWLARKPRGTNAGAADSAEKPNLFLLGVHFVRGQRRDTRDRRSDRATEPTSPQTRRHGSGHRSKRRLAVAACETIIMAVVRAEV